MVNLPRPEVVNLIGASTLQNYVSTQLNNGVVTISAFVGNGVYQSIDADNPVVGSTSSSNYVSGNTNITFNSVTIFDNYNYVGAKTFFNTYSFYNNNDPAAEPIVKTNRTAGFVTGEKIRVLDNDYNPLNDKFLYSTAYYDETGRTLQSISDNHKTGIDYQTSQYDFSGKVLSECTKHNILSGTVYTVISRQVYDKIGRLKEFYKSYNGSAYKQLSEYKYDELGYIKSKRIAPNGSNSQMETQNYSYNINGLLTGINKAYAFSNNNYSQWDNYFSEYLGYDNRDNVFADAQYNGNISGLIWKSQGDNTPRKYDFTYDRVGRFTSALFKQKAKPSDITWSNSVIDFSVYMDYEDGNGNIKSMKQIGVVPGANGIRTVDDLRYSYFDVSGITGLRGNMLKQVDDLGNLANNNGMLGDFKETSTSQDYYYDKEGNLVKDLNKDIQGTAGANGVIYNFLNKPVKIILNNKSTVEYTYDASGEKLSKKITQNPSAANGNHTIITTTDYIGDFVYETVATTPALNPNTDYTNKLIFILHEEGRLKMITPISNTDRELSAGTGGVVFNSSQHGVFEFFVKDHLASTRMVLTEEVQKEFYRATMDASSSGIEEPIFGSVDASGNPSTTNELQATRYLNPNPATSPWPNHTTDFVKLSAVQSSTKIGPNVMLKVMAGDLISTTAKYYYLNNNNTGPGTSISPVLTSLINALMSPNKGSLLGKNFNGDINTSLTADLNTFINTTQPSQGLTDRPLAYINIVFLDEQFRFIDMDPNDPGVGTYSLRVNNNNDANAQFPLIIQKAPKNGWVFVYLSNQSNEPVYFDDFYVSQEHGKISEENHYYPYGLKIAGVSSQAFNKLDSRYGYQGDYSEEETESGWDEFDLRNYDPQIGRWIGVDPFDELPSGYVGMANDPVNFTDPSGGLLFDNTTSMIGMGIGFGLGVYFAAKYDNPAYVPVLMLSGGLVGYGLSEGLGFGPTSPKQFEIYYKYGRFNVGLLNYTPLLPELLSGLYQLSGLDFQIDANGYLGYSRVRPAGSNDEGKVAYNRNMYASSYARTLIINMIETGRYTDVIDNLGHGNYVSPLFPDDIMLDQAEARAIQRGARNVSPKSFSMAMILLHEFGHTQAGGQHPDELRNANGTRIDGKDEGINEKHFNFNKIRRQMSRFDLSWGKRRTYRFYPIGGDSYLAMNNRARRQILRAYFKNKPLRLSKRAKFVVL